jgi:hypothetical protein
MPPGIANVLVIVTHEPTLTEEHVASATRALKAANDAGDDAFFARRGFQSARDFYAQYARLSAVVAPAGGVMWINREARQPLPRDVSAALGACLASLD